jgi:hypothetical protein
MVEATTRDELVSGLVRIGEKELTGEVTVFYERGRCRHYAECVRGLPQVFDPTPPLPALGRRPSACRWLVRPILGRMTVA